MAHFIHAVEMPTFAGWLARIALFAALYYFVRRRRAPSKAPPAPALVRVLSREESHEIRGCEVRGPAVVLGTDVLRKRPRLVYTATRVYF